MATERQRVEFVCPRCRTSCGFGSGRGDDGVITRNCHGPIPRGEPCGFTWPITDDWRHFALVTVVRPQTEEEYEVMRRRYG